MLRRSISLAFIALTLAGPAARADDLTLLGRFAGWTVFSGTASDGSNMCVVGIQGDNREFLIKSIHGNRFLAVQAYNDTWNIDQDARVQVVTWLDGINRYTVDAVRSVMASGIEWHVDIDVMEDFIGRFRHGHSLTLTFPNSNEGTWNIDLRGSSAGFARFAECTRGLGAQRSNRPSQPH